MGRTERVRCPRCGGLMNHHADKLVSSVEGRPAAFDPALGGVVHQTHTCPACAYVEFRPEQPTGGSTGPTA